MAAHQAPPSLGFSRQEHWSGLPFPSPMSESEKWKGSCSVMSDSSWPHGLQPTRLLHPWDFPGKSTGVGCHCLLRKQHTTLQQKLIKKQKFKKPKGSLVALIIWSEMKDKHNSEKHYSREEKIFLYKIVFLKMYRLLLTKINKQMKKRKKQSLKTHPDKTVLDEKKEKCLWRFSKNLFGF